jgi:decaprenyl-phosphate phosphoribosyltransferase
VAPMTQSTDRRAVPAEAPDSTAEKPSAGAALKGLARGIRPRQWVKNVLVLISPIVAGAIFDPEVWPAVIVAFVAFSMASSATYLFNDILDIEADRRHPKKRHRPLASGVLPVWVAAAAAVVLALGALTLCLVTGETGLLIVLGVYVVLQILYCLWLKHEVLLDIVLISSGFLLRAVAGGVATDVGLSQWFLLVAGFGSLLMAAGKRYSELVLLESADPSTIGSTRPVLRKYTGTYLRLLVTVSTGLLIAFYSLWAFEMAQLPGRGGLWAPLSIVPFVLASLRYVFEIDRGEAGSPESVAFKDHALQVIALAWLAVIGWGIYLS